MADVPSSPPPDAVSDGITAGAAGAPASALELAAARVASIVETAERGAAELRTATEARAAERIAEAQRAGELRVAAAEAEALEIVSAAHQESARARAEAEAAVRTIHDEAARVRAEADAHREQQLDSTRGDVAAMLVEAQELADETRRRARADAQAIVGEAHSAARRVMREGAGLSDQLEQLSTSLHRNAERLLGDVSAAHRALVGQLDAVQPGAAPPPDRLTTGEERDARALIELAAADELTVPEFVPPR